jgi:glucokinase
MTLSKAYIVMDVGGTFIKSGIMSADGRLLDSSQQTVPINSDGTKEEICNSLTSAVCQGISLARYYGYTPGGVGICMPGPFNYITGISSMVHKFAAIKDIPLKEVIKEALDGLDIPVVFGHDVNTQLYGEMCGGNAQGFDNVCLVALGTGLGFAMANEGKVLQTETGGPLISIWNLPYNEGILEDYASKRGFYNTWEMVTGERPSAELTVAEMGHRAGEGDPTALEVFRRVGSFIGQNIKGRLEEYHIERLLFGGQISRSFRYMEESVRQELGDLEGLTINTVSDFSNAAFKGLAEMLNALND